MVLHLIEKLDIVLNFIDEQGISHRSHILRLDDKKRPCTASVFLHSCPQFYILLMKKTFHLGHFFLQIVDDIRHLIFFTTLLIIKIFSSGPGVSHFVDEKVLHPVDKLRFWVFTSC